MSDEPTIIARRYRLGETIGHGGMGDVFKGTDTHTSDLVAIKRLHDAIVEENPDIVDRFEREGEALRQLNHPNIVTVLNTVEEGGKHYLIMEYVAGGSLRDLIDEQSRLPVEAVLNVALDLCDALTRAHRLNIIHRDIKPDNVLLAEDGTPRLTDFGVAHLGGRTRLTQTGSVIGTYAYLSPEACNAEELDERTDIWSLGVMLFEMLAGRVPFNEQSTAAVLTAILTRPAPDLRRLRPNVPEPLLNLIYSMLEKDRARRIPSIRLVGAELEAIIRGIDTPFRDLATMVGALPPELGSRFATPSDEYKDIPAMVSSQGQTHGLSLYPGQVQPTGPQYTPGGTPITGEYPAVPNKWPWLSLAIIATVIACAVVLIVGIIWGPDRLNNANKPDAATGPPADIAGQFAIVSVEPVQPDEYMILVANLEPIGDVTRRDVARFIADDLDQTLRIDVPFSNLQIRRYPVIITTDAEAQQAAEANGAAIVIWGTYTPDAIRAEIQIGDLSVFPDLHFDRALLERTLNISVQFTDERRESLAHFVLTALNGLQNADGDAYETLRTGTIQGLVDVTSAEVLSTNVAAHVHRAAMADSIDGALDEIDAAFEIDAANPLLYIWRINALQREGRFDTAISEARTARRLGPEGWAMPLLLEASMVEDMTVLDLFNEVIAARPDDWFPYFFRGTIYYSIADVIPNGEELARADLDRSLALDPDASFPYVYSALLAAHEGNFAHIGDMLAVILTEYPDPNVMERMIRVTFNNQVLNPYVVTISAFTDLALGRYNEVVTETSEGLESFPGSTDLIMLQGIAHCALGDYAAAETSFTAALETDPTFTLMHLLRASARQKQTNADDAAADFDAIEASDQRAALDPYVAALNAGTLDCGNFLGPENPVFSLEFSASPETAAPGTGTPAASRATATPDPITAVAPVEAGETMVLVADLEPLGNVIIRDVSRFIADDLGLTLEESVAYTETRVRRYPAIITTSAEAARVAQATDAAVIVWGNYNEDEIEVKIQVGATGAFPHNEFTHDTLAKTGNVRALLRNERRESIAVPVTGIINLLYLADGDQYDYLLTMTMIQDLNVTRAEIVGDTVGANVHRALAAYFDDAPSAVAQFTDAIALDSGNPLLYAYRAITQLRNGDFDSAVLDMQTAARLGPDDWTTPDYFGVQQSLEETIAQLIAATETRPDDWYPPFILGIIHYLELNDRDSARRYLAQSIALDPEANTPFVATMLIALRDGHIATAQEYATTILTQSPDPDLTNRAFDTLYGNTATAQEALTGEYFAAGTNIVIGQYNDVIRIVDQALAPLFDSPAPPGLLGETSYALSDVYLLQGLAYCNLHNYDRAVEAYSQAIRFSDDYALAYLLRGQMRLKLLDNAGATVDFDTARAHTLDATFDVWVEAAINGDWTCENLFDYSLQ
jgi:serine/threonine protein kinase/tetratricopeptide (TPR) repeat protein